MTLMDQCDCSWSLLATDVNSAMINKARKGIYLDNRTSLLSDEYRKRFCRKGIEEFDGHFRIIPELRKSVQFMQFNLLDDMSNLGQFDLIFLRNVLIYFDEQSKKKILDKITLMLKPGGFLFTGHAESFHGLCPKLISVQPAILTLRS